MRSHKLLALALVSMFVISMLAVVPAGATGQAVGNRSILQLTSHGTVTLGGTTNSAPSRLNAGAQGSANPALELRREDGEIEKAGSDSAAVGAPNSDATSVTNSNPGFSGFSGLSHFDQRFAGTGSYANTNFSLEPPDQGLCVGNGFVLEAINDALQVFKKSGARVGLTIPINQFFNLAPEFIRPAGPFGDFTSDPKCYYDVATNRWFLTVLQIDVDPTTGNFGHKSHVELAVSQTGNPSGTWNLFSLDATNASHTGCPCFGDQPLIGADKYGFYMSTAEYSLEPFGAVFNGPQIYATSKAKLVAGAPGPVVHFFDLGSDSGTVQPATSPTPAGFETGNRGTEYFMSGFDTLPPDGHLNPGPDNRIRVWSLTNTRSLNSSPDVELTEKVLRSETYSQPPAVRQKRGPTPLRDCLADPVCAAPAPPVQEKFAKLNSNDDRMNQVVFSDGLLWSGINTAIRTGDGPKRTGIAYFIVKPDVEDGQVEGDIIKQGYISVAGNSVMFPSIGVNDAGAGTIVFTLAGPNYFPSAAYASVDAVRGAGDVHIAGAGLGPEDGFTGYPSQGGGNGVARWGDYSAAVAEPSGRIWFATEYIGQSCTFAQFSADFTCGGTRSFFANWGTFIGSVSP